MNNNFKLIGLYGYSRSGKDTIANYLVKNHGFERRAFADPLRKVLYNILKAWDGSSYLIDNYGWDYAKKEFPEIVDAMIALGAGMRELNPDVWIPGVFNGDYPQHLVISDVRHPNEAEAVWDAGGELWKVTRPGTEPRAMDTMLENWQFDRHIENTGTLEELEEKVSLGYYMHFKNQDSI